ncbi:hypothetical protein JW960_18070 [candidate division KSB1 bacterium]|nr:hypothetical protein [candidate division KSB1 bacterium]
MSPIDFFRSGITITLPLLLTLVACDKNSTEPEPSTRVVIDNNAGSYNDRITYYDDLSLEITPLDSTLHTLYKSSNNDTVILKLRASIQPPEIGGQLLHCNHVTLNGNLAYVSFHTPEDQYRGAIYVVDISNTRKPAIVSVGTFMDTDITIAIRQDQTLYVGEATDIDKNKQFASPAVLEKIKLDKGLLTSDIQRVDINSFNCNDIVIHGDVLYATSGTTGGGLSVLNSSDLSVQQFIELDAAKACGIYGNEIVVLEGTGTTLHCYDRTSFAPTRSIDLGYPNNYQAKAEIDIQGHQLFLSAWEAGMKVVDMRSGIKTDCIVVDNNGHCNGVSVDGNLAFMANGSEGVYVVRVINDKLSILGRIMLEASANFVETRGNILFVATGEQGFLVIEIAQNGR